MNYDRIIRKFIAEHKNTEEEKEYKELKKLKTKFDIDTVYEFLTLRPEEQVNLLDEMLNPAEKKLVGFEEIKNIRNFDIKQMVNGINERMLHIDPIIYVYVNGITMSYDYIDKNIVTKQYSSIEDGIIIKYKNKIYDYSVIH